MTLSPSFVRTCALALAVLGCGPADAGDAGASDSGPPDAGAPSEAIIWIGSDRAVVDDGPAEAIAAAASSDRVLVAYLQPGRLDDPTRVALLDASGALLDAEIMSERRLDSHSVASDGERFLLVGAGASSVRAWLFDRDGAAIASALLSDNDATSFSGRSPAVDATWSGDGWTVSWTEYDTSVRRRVSRVARLEAELEGAPRVWDLGAETASAYGGVWVARGEDRTLVTWFSEEGEGAERVFRTRATLVNAMGPRDPLGLPLFEGCAAHAGRAAPEPGGFVVTSASCSDTTPDGWVIAHRVDDALRPRVPAHLVLQPRIAEAFLIADVALATDGVSLFAATATQLTRHVAGELALARPIAERAIGALVVARGVPLALERRLRAVPLDASTLEPLGTGAPFGYRAPDQWGVTFAASPAVTLVALAETGGATYVGVIDGERDVTLRRAPDASACPPRLLEDGGAVHLVTDRSTPSPTLVRRRIEVGSERTIELGDPVELGVSGCGTIVQGRSAALVLVAPLDEPEGALLRVTGGEHTRIGSLDCVAPIDGSSAVGVPAGEGFVVTRSCRLAGFFTSEHLVAAYVDVLGVVHGPFVLEDERVDLLVPGGALRTSDGRWWRVGISGFEAIDRPPVRLAGYADGSEHPGGGVFLGAGEPEVALEMSYDPEGAEWTVGRRWRLPLSSEGRRTPAVVHAWPDGRLLVAQPHPFVFGGEVGMEEEGGRMGGVIVGSPL